MLTCIVRINVSNVSQQDVLVIGIFSALENVLTNKEYVTEFDWASFKNLNLMNIFTFYVLRCMKVNIHLHCYFVEIYVLCVEEQ